MALDVLVDEALLLIDPTAISSVLFNGGVEKRTKTNRPSSPTLANLGAIPLLRSVVDPKAAPGVGSSKLTLPTYEVWP